MLARIKYATGSLDAMQGCILLAPSSAYHQVEECRARHRTRRARRLETMRARRDNDDKYCELGSQKIIKENTRAVGQDLRVVQLLVI